MPGREHGSEPAGERGFALLIVLWAVVLLSLLATQLTAAGRTEVQLAGNLKAAAATEAAADGAIQEAAFHLLDPASRWAADGRDRQVQVPGARVALRIDNEAGKVNPNLAEPPLLQALMGHLGADQRSAESIADAIADWRYPDAQPRPHGAKAPQYRAAGLDYGPPGTPFSSLDELGAVLGMTPALLDRMRPYLSVLTDAAPDPAAAAPPVLQAIRDVSGPPRGASAPLPPRTVTITAQATGDAGGRFTRRAAVRLGATGKEPLALVLTWEAPSP